MSNQIFDDSINRPQSDVRGWLDGLEDLQATTSSFRGSMSRPITTDRSSHDDNFIRRPHSSASMNSQDSVNLDDIIRSNDTIDIQETGLMPYLEDLDIDDTNDEFWKMDETLANLHISKDHSPPSEKSALKVAQPHANLRMLSEPKRGGMKPLNSVNNDTTGIASDPSLNNNIIDDFYVDNYWSESIKDEAEKKLSVGGGISFARNSAFSRSNDSLASENTILARNGQYSSSISRRQAGGLYSNPPIGTRSPSQSSENSYTSQSTIPASTASGNAQSSPTSLRPTQSNSSSFRPSSRLSDYSVQSYGSASGLPRPKPPSTEKLSGSKSFSARGSAIAAKKSTGLKDPNMLPRMPARTTTPVNTPNASKLAKRASHIPAPSKTRTTPVPQKTLSSYSTGRESPSRMSNVPKLPRGASSLRMTSTSNSGPKESSSTSYFASSGTPQTSKMTHNGLFSAPQQPSMSANNQFLNDGERREPTSMLPRRSMTPNAARSPSRIGVMRKA